MFLYHAVTAYVGMTRAVSGQFQRIETHGAAPQKKHDRKEPKERQTRLRKSWPTH